MSLPKWFFSKTLYSSLREQEEELDMSIFIRYKRHDELFGTKFSEAGIGKSRLVAELLDEGCICSKCYHYETDTCCSVNCYEGLFISNDSYLAALREEAWEEAMVPWWKDRVYFDETAGFTEKAWSSLSSITPGEIIPPTPPIVPWQGIVREPEYDAVYKFFTYKQYDEEYGTDISSDSYQGVCHLCCYDFGASECQAADCIGGIFEKEEEAPMKPPAPPTPAATVYSKSGDKLAQQVGPYVEYDMVHKVKHYQLFPELDLEVIDVIHRAVELSGLKGKQAYDLGNALKYLLRIGRKGDVAEDAGKAIRYLEWLKEDK